MEIKNVTFSYDNVTNRLKSVSSEIEIGKITTIIGRMVAENQHYLVLCLEIMLLIGEVILDGKTIVV